MTTRDEEDTMTREHLIEDIRNVITLVQEVERSPEDAQRVRRAFQGLCQHIRNEGSAPERVVHCLEESIRVLEEAGESVDGRTWGYARTCLESALEFAREQPAGAA
jgi:hypothetical protein